MISEDDIRGIDNKVAQMLAAAVTFAQESPYPVPEDLEVDIYA